MHQMYCGYLKMCVMPKIVSYCPNVQPADYTELDNQSDMQLLGQVKENEKRVKWLKSDWY